MPQSALGATPRRDIALMRLRLARQLSDREGG
jgi:hypothetical protein